MRFTCSFNKKRKHEQQILFVSDTLYLPDLAISASETPYSRKVILNLCWFFQVDLKCYVVVGRVAQVMLKSYH